MKINWEQVMAMKPSLLQIAGKVVSDAQMLQISEGKVSRANSIKAFLHAINYADTFEGNLWDGMRSALWNYMNDPDSSGEASRVLFASLIHGSMEVARWRYVGEPPEEAFKRAYNASKLSVGSLSYRQALNDDLGHFIARYASPYARVAMEPVRVNSEEEPYADIMQAMYFNGSHNIPVITDGLKELGSCRVLLCGRPSAEAYHLLHQMVAEDLANEIYCGYIVIYSGLIDQRAHDKYLVECARSKIPMFFVHNRDMSYRLHKEMCTALAKNYWSGGADEANLLLSYGNFFPLDIGATSVAGVYNCKADRKGVYVGLEYTPNRLHGVEGLEQLARRSNLESNPKDAQNAEAILGILHGCVVRFTVPYQHVDNPHVILDELILNVRRVVSSRDGLVNISLPPMVQDWVNQINVKNNDFLTVPQRDFDLADQTLHSWLWTLAHLEVFIPIDTTNIYDNLF